MTQYSRSLEKAKARLTAEVEDLTVLTQRERVDERAIEKNFLKLEEQVEKSAKRLQQEEKMRQVAEQEASRLQMELTRLRSAASPTYGYQSVGVQRSRSAFENIPPPNQKPPSGVNGTANGAVLPRKRYDSLIADLEKRDIYGKDGAKDDALRSRILKELTDSNRELAASMGARELEAGRAALGRRS